MLAAELGLNGLKEAPRLGALDHAVIIGRGDRHHLLGADRCADVLKPNRVADRACRDDRPLAGHQPRHRSTGANSAGVSQRHIRSDEVIGGESVGPSLVDQLVEGCLEGDEVDRPGIRDHRHDQRPRAVLLLNVDRDSEVDGAVVGAHRFAVLLKEVVCHHRHLVGRCARDRPGDQVREGDLVAGRL